MILIISGCAEVTVKKMEEEQDFQLIDQEAEELDNVINGQQAKNTIKGST